MAGIYLHIPFCKQACYYCDFHFSTYHNLIDPLIEAMHHELSLRQNYLGKDIIDTIYFGGGTPSLLKTELISSLLDRIHRHFKVNKNAEITLEANPDDLNSGKLSDLSNTGINRLSIGVQSFDDSTLQYINRTHTGQEALGAIQTARDEGFANINVDLIHGITKDHYPVLEKDLKMIKKLLPKHISIYSLTIEKDTVFGRWLRKNKIEEVDEDIIGEEYEIISKRLSGLGYDHYETSNFAIPGYISKHNSNYWQQVPYLGIGPSAHSFNKEYREYNIGNNALYIKSIQKDKIPARYDYLTLSDKVNEIILTSIRTKWGCDLKKILVEYDVNIINRNKDYIDHLIHHKMAEVNNGILKLVNKGRLMADKIASDLFICE